MGQMDNPVSSMPAPVTGPALPTDPTKPKQLPGFSLPGRGNPNAIRNAIAMNKYNEEMKPLARIRREQQRNAINFRNELPGMKGRMGSQMEQAANNQMGQNLNQVNNYDSNRGLLYGGLHAGNQQAERARTQAAMASGRSAINSGLENQANALDVQAIQTGVGVQQTQQSIQNSIYAQAMAKMQADNQAFGGLLQAGGTAAAIALV